MDERTPPKEPERISVGRYTEPLWEYNGKMYSYDGAARRYEYDRAEFWKSMYESAVSAELPQEQK